MINSGRAGRPYRYAWAASGKPGWFLFDGLVRHDLHTGNEERLRFGDGVVCTLELPERISSGTHSTWADGRELRRWHTADNAASAIGLHHRNPRRQDSPEGAKDLGGRALAIVEVPPSVQPGDSVAVAVTAKTPAVPAPDTPSPASVPNSGGKGVVMRLWNRSKGARQSGLSTRVRIGAILTVLGLTAGGGLLAAGSASAEPWNPNVDVVGHVAACGPRSFPVGIHYWGNTGDRGFVPVRHGSYRVALHRVPQRGEFVGGTIDCAWRPPARFGFKVERPRHGTTVQHAI
jgi:Retinal pigment epithelial membrane protein